MRDNTQLNDWARRAAVVYMERKGYRVDATDFHGFIVAMDEGTLVLASVGINVSSTGVLLDSRRLRQECESAAFMWVMEQELVGDFQIRFDCIDMTVATADSDSAMLRHHINCWDRAEA